MKKLLVFTDLDGTLLDHNNYDWRAAMPAINRLKAHSFPLILNSSKTSSEIKQLRDALGNNDPFICENGAVVYCNEKLHESNEDNMEVFYFARPYAYIKEVMAEIRARNDFDMFGFDDIDINTLMELTELDKQSAQASKQREASEPIVWNDTDKSLEKFTKLLNDKDLTLTKGGRFLHIISPVSKGDSIKWLIKKYQNLEPETQWLTVGLGDSFNDVSMFEQVDYPILIQNPHGKKPDLNHIPNLIESDKPGPEGWNVEILNLINTIQEMNHG